MKQFFTTIIFIATFAAYAVNQYLGSASTLTSEPTATPIAALATSTNDALAVNVTSSSTEGTTQQAPTQKPAASTTQKAPTQKPIEPTRPPTSIVTTRPPTTTPVVRTPRGQYVDGTYTGSPANAVYGYVQVRATIAGGKLAAVTFLSHPSGRHESDVINARAIPRLTQEAIAAQSASVAGVSGATDTSIAFRQSLSSALAAAKNS